MRFLRTNTAVRLTVGPFFDKTDGVTPETAITVTSCKLTLMVDDANVPTLVLDAAPTASGGANDMVHVTGDDAGFYDLELAAANVNYVGRAMLAITDAAVHCPVFHEFMILPAMVYDSLVLGTDTLQADVTQWLGTAASTPTVAGVPNVNVKTWNDLTTVALPLIPTTAGRTLDVSAAGEAGVDWANVGSPTTTVGLSGTTVKTATDVETDTADIQTRLPAALVGGRMDSNMQAGATGVITATLIAPDAIGASELAADAVAEIQSGLSTLDAAGVRTAVGLASANLDTQLDALPTNAELATSQAAADDATLAAIAALNNLSSAQAQTAAAAALTAYDPPTHAETTAAALAAFTTALTESYGTDGSAATAAQLLYQIWARLAEFAISGTTITAKKLDGTTTAFTLTLDSATTPTSSARAT